MVECSFMNILPEATNSFTYYFLALVPKSNIENVPKGVALRLRRICDSFSKFHKRSIEYQKYLIARDYINPGKSKIFSDVIWREEVRRPKKK